MSTVTQNIPHFLSGISQQQDKKKFPHQLKDAVNTFPDYALGLLKRPGGQFIKTLYSATPRGKWFSILRDENEKYIAQYDVATASGNSTFRVWNLADGTPRKVNMGTNTGVPGGCNQANLQTDTLDYNTKVLTTQTELNDLNVAQADFQKKNEGQDVSRVELSDTEFTYNEQNGTVEETVKSGIMQHATNNTYTIKEAGVIKIISQNDIAGPVLELERVDGGASYAAAASVATTSNGSGTGLVVTFTVTGGVIDQVITIVNRGGSTVTTGYKVGDEISLSTGGNGNGAGKFKVSKLMYEKGKELTDEHPNFASGGYKYFELIKHDEPAYNAAERAAASTAMSAAQNNYNTAVTAEATSKSAYDSELANCAISSVPSDAYLKDANAEDIEILTLNDYTFVLNKTKTVAWTSDTSTALPHQCFIVINVATYNSKYEVKLGGDTFQYTTAEDASAGDADAATIVTQLTALITADADFTATATGPGIYVSSSSAFTVDVIGGAQENSMYAFQDQITSVARLPLQCKNGYKVKVANSANIAEDDMWVTFNTTGGAAYGPGTWSESIEPGLNYKLDPLTMPHQLVRQADGSFTYSAVTWEERDVGDDLTNPAPSFVGSTIRNMFFFRNRFGFLSGDTVIMSKADSFFDFFVGSAQIAAADDPIDISASSTRPVFLNYVKTTSAGLVMFSDNEQFLLSTDSDILSPETAKINTLAAYEADTNIEPVNLGTSLAFISKTPLWSRLFEISGISLTDPPQMFNTSSIVPELVPATIDSMAGSAGMSMISIGEVGKSTLYQFRFYQVPEGRKASTWYKWELTSNLRHQFFDVSTFYAVTDDGTNVSVQSVDLRQASDSGYLTLPTGEKTDVCMDMFDIEPYRTYDVATDKTRVFLPFTHLTGKTFTVVALGDYIGTTPGANTNSTGAILYPTVAGSAGSEYADITGDYRGKSLILGYTYTMTVDLPKLYYSQQKGELPTADYTADLIIHRIKVSTGLSGPIKYNVNLTGIPNRTHTVSVVHPYTYVANNVAMASEGIHDVPIFQRNENISLSIVGDTPLPVSLLGMNWEGKYNKKFYNRV